MCLNVCVCVYIRWFAAFFLVLCVMAIISIPTKVNGASERTSGEKKHPESTHKERKIYVWIGMNVCVGVCECECVSVHIHLFSRAPH